jgi:hypothetical protein
LLVLYESKKLFSCDLFQVGLSRCPNKTQENIYAGKRAAKGVGAAVAPVVISKILPYILFARYLFVMELAENTLKDLTSAICAF